ncbi:Hypothetical_protein [Hexamita inflata]|uniref:Hypothetical_protein n=1 Tax=Hexamita inflata TaxID=28002 RepID=A0AA86PGH5_9EUKA|nr:Hypothetical protein HINF_LOCUS26494 [Hexamita inflata]
MPRPVVYQDCLNEKSYEKVHLALNSFFDSISIQPANITKELHKFIAIGKRSLQNQDILNYLEQFQNSEDMHKNLVPYLRHCMEEANFWKVSGVNMTQVVDAEKIRPLDRKCAVVSPLPPKAIAPRQVPKSVSPKLQKSPQLHQSSQYAQNVLRVTTFSPTRLKPIQQPLAPFKFQKIVQKPRSQNLPLKPLDVEAQFRIIKKQQLKIDVPAVSKLQGFQNEFEQFTKQYERLKTELNQFQWMASGSQQPSNLVKSDLNVIEEHVELEHPEENVEVEYNTRASKYTDSGSTANQEHIIFGKAQKPKIPNNETKMFNVVPFDDTKISTQQLIQQKQKQIKIYQKWSEKWRKHDPTFTYNQFRSKYLTLVHKISTYRLLLSKINLSNTKYQLQMNKEFLNKPHTFQQLVHLHSSKLVPLPNMLADNLKLITFKEKPKAVTEYMKQLFNLSAQVLPLLIQNDYTILSERGQKIILLQNWNQQMEKKVIDIFNANTKKPLFKKAKKYENGWFLNQMGSEEATFVIAFLAYALEIKIEQMI